METSKPKLKRISIYYRHVHSDRQLGKFRPEWFDYETAFLSLIDSIRVNDTDTAIDITILFDGDNNSLKSDFMSKYLRGDLNTNGKFSITCSNIDGGSNLGAWKDALKYIRNARKYNDDELIYILENDYIHASNWISEVRNLFDSEIEFHYISLYDHSDKYLFHAQANHSYRNLVSKIFVTSSHHWRTTPSTCGTFLVRPAVFFADYPIWNTGRLTDRKIFPLLRWLKRRILLTPMPGLSTHCMNEYMSPTINWKEYANNS